MKYLFILSLVGVLFCAASFGEEDLKVAPESMHEISQPRAKDSKEPDGILLIDLRNKKTLKVERDASGNYKLLPNRLYRRYEPQLKKYVFDLTDRHGRLANPPRALLPFSDLPGEWVGAEKGVAFAYVGGAKKGWDLWQEIKAEDANGKYMFWNLSDPPEESVHFHSVTKEDTGGP